MASPIASFYDSEALVPLIHIIAFLFIVEPSSMLFIAMLEKEFKFKQVTIFSLIKLFTTTGITVGLVYNGFGAFSIVWVHLLGALLFGIVLFLYFRTIWWPSLCFSVAAVKPFLHFGIYISGENALNEFGKSIDEIILGRVIGLEALNTYHLAKQVIEKIITLITSTINKVFYPIYSKIRKQNEGKVFKQTYLQTTNIVATLGYPAFSILILMLSVVITTFFGQEWHNSIIIMRVLCVKGMFDIILNEFASSSLYVHNKPKTVFQVDLVITPIRVVFIYLSALVSV